MLEHACADIIQTRLPLSERQAAILALHLSGAPLAEDTNLHAIAQAAAGYVGADLAALAREAGMAALQRSVTAAGGVDRVAADRVNITQGDLQDGLKRSAPSLLRGLAAETPALNWEAIGGLEAEKSTLQEAVEWPKKHTSHFKKLSLRPPRGILLTGAPGTGKTLLARALAGADGLNFIPVRPPDLLSQFLGQAERSVARLFETARFTAPSLLFFDEIDALAPRRGSSDGVFDRIVAQLLVELDGISGSEGLTVLAATNRASSLDPALLRPGRFDQVIEIGLPDLKTRSAILQVHFGGRPCAPDVSLPEISKATDGLSGAELAALAEFAAWAALRRSVLNGQEPQITVDDITDALKTQTERQAAIERDFISTEGDS